MLVTKKETTFSFTTVFLYSISFVLKQKKQKFKKKICFRAPFVSSGYATGHFTPTHKAQGNGSLC